MSDSKQPRPKPESNLTAGVVRADELYLWTEIQKRLRWRRHSARQAQRLGLKPIKFGSRLYVHGSTVLKWFEKLSQQQNEV